MAFPSGGDTLIRDGTGTSVFTLDAVTVTGSCSTSYITYSLFMDVNGIETDVSTNSGFSWEESGMKLTIDTTDSSYLA